MQYKTLENDEFVLKLTFRNGNDYYYGAYRKIDMVRVGECGIRLDMIPENYYYGNIEYHVYDEYQGRGYASSFTKILGNFALSMGITKMNISCLSDNLASIKTIENLGCTFLEVTKIPEKYSIVKMDEEVAIYEWNIKESRR